MKTVEKLETNQMHFSINSDVVNSPIEIGEIPYNINIYRIVCEAKDDSLPVKYSVSCKNSGYSWSVLSMHEKVKHDKYIWKSIEYNDYLFAYEGQKIIIWQDKPNINNVILYYHKH